MTKKPLRQSNPFRIASCVAPLLVASAALFAQQGHVHDASHQAKTHEPTSKPVAKSTSRIGDIYPLDVCPVSGAALGSMGDPIIMIHEGREIRFCCESCVPKFQADPATYLPAVDTAITAAQKGSFPLEFCMISSDEKIEADEEENAYWVFGNRLFVFCCPGCEKEVVKDPKKYFAQLDAAVVAAQSSSYPIDTCVVSGDKLGGDMGEPINYVFNGKLVRFCCKGCIKTFEKDPHHYMKMLQDTSSASSAPQAHHGEASGHEGGHTSQNDHSAHGAHHG